MSYVLNAVLAGIALVAPPAPVEVAAHDYALSAPKPAALQTGLVSRQPLTAAMPRRAAPKGMQGNLTGEVQYIEGPAWSVQPVCRGPKLEVGALGGGMESAPYLAHVGVDWHF